MKDAGLCLLADRYRPTQEVTGQTRRDLIINVSSIIRGRNNSKISGSQQDYLVGKSGSPQICVVVIWPRFSQNNMTIFVNICQIVW